MKKVICFVFVLTVLLAIASVAACAVDYTGFNIVFEEKEGEKVNGTDIRIYSSVDDGALTDRTDEFTLEDIKWFKYISAPAEGNTAEDYDYTDEELGIYGILCTDSDLFDHENYSYFLMISRLYAKEEDSFTRNVKINGVDVDEMQGSCYNTGNEFFIKTITNGFSGSSGESDVTSEPAATDNTPDHTSEPVTEKTSKDKCKVCGICPIQPLGICLFIWIAIIIIVLILLVILVSKGKKKDKNNN